MARGSPRPRAEAPIPCPTLPLPPRPASLPERDRAPTLPANFAGLEKNGSRACCAIKDLVGEDQYVVVVTLHGIYIVMQNDPHSNYASRYRCYITPKTL